MPIRIETPADFAENGHLPTADLAKRYGVCPSTVHVFLKRIGKPRTLGNREMRPVPDDFADRAREMGVHRLTGHYNAGRKTVDRWLREAAPRDLKKRVEMPADFASFAADFTCRQMEARFGITRSTLIRWERASGGQCQRESGAETLKRRKAAKVKPHKALKIRKVRAPRPPKTPRETPVEFTRAAPPPRKVHKPRATGLRDHGPLRDMTRAGQAADFLRKLDAVRRCDAQGEFSLTGDHWHFRGRLFDAAGIIERAERAGFDPDAWMRIAA